MRQLSATALLAAFAGLAFGASSAKAQMMAPPPPGYYYVRPAAPAAAYQAPRYYYTPAPTARANYGRDYLNRPLTSPYRGFARDVSTARNVPYAKPWLRQYSKIW